MPMMYLDIFNVIDGTQVDILKMDRKQCKKFHCPLLVQTSIFFAINNPASRSTREAASHHFFHLQSIYFSTYSFPLERVSRLEI